MRILMLNNEYPPLGGGQASANKSTLEAIQNLEFSITVDLITSSTDKYKTEKTSLGEISYLDIGKKGKNFHYQNIKDLLIYSAKAFFLSKKKLKKQAYDYVIAWAGVPSGFIAYLLNKFSKTPYIVLLRGPDVPFHEAKWKILDKFVLQYISPLIWRNAFKVITNSKELKTLAQRSAKNQQILVIENGVDFNFWKNGSNKHLTDFKNMVILSVGRISKIKGFDLVIEAISLMDIKNIEYWIVGDGPERVHLQELSETLNCKEQVKFLGIKSKMELLEIYHSASVFCLPSYNEGMSNALMEAMASGLPVVVTNVGGTVELVDNNGIIVEKGNPRAIAEALNVILTDDEVYNRMFHKSAEIASQKTWYLKTSELLDMILKN